MRKRRGAIVGFGKVVELAHLPGFRQSPGFEIVAVVDPSAERRARAAASLPGVRVYGDLASAIEAEPTLDFVDVASPPRSHGQAVTQALARGVHALCEKPLALDLAEAAELSRATRRSGRVLFTVHNWKYAPLLRRLHGLLQAGAVGELAEIEWQVLRPSPPQGAAEAGWRLDPREAGGGILMDHGWHACYLLLFLTGRAPRSLVARLGTSLGLGVEDSVECEIDFGGVRARIELRWGAAERRTGGVARGSFGEVRITDDRLVVAVSGRSAEATRFAPALSASSYHPEWFPALLEDFRAEMEHAEQRGRNLTEALCVAEMIGAAYRSAGAAVPLADPSQPGAGSG